MAKREKLRTFIPPEGWTFYSPVGEYYEKLYTTDENGNRYMVINWFNPIHGTYQQGVYRIDPATGSLEKTEDNIPKDISPLKKSLLQYPTAKQKTTMLIATIAVLAVVCVILNFMY